MNTHKTIEDLVNNDAWSFAFGDLGLRTNTGYLSR